MVASDARRIATYARVSSEDQAERGTIRTQADELDRYLERQPDAALVRRYVDDGVSGTIPLGERPAGSQLLRDARAGRFTEVLVHKFDRLGRDAPDLLAVGRALREAGVTLRSLIEGAPDLFMWDILAAVSDNDRRTFLRRSADGTNRAAREGRYVGGIVAFGYVVAGTKPHARLVPDTAPLWATLSAADVVRRMYGWLADGWSCRRIAQDLNGVGVPTHYVRDGRGVRGQRTRGVWRAGRVRNLLINPIYRGELLYGRRTTKREREQISASVEPLVSVELWQQAQATLRSNRLVPTTSARSYLLKGVLRCSLCGLTYVGSQGNGATWYRCGGQLVERGPLPGRCPGHAVKGEAIEPLVWADLEQLLRDPGDLLAELDLDAERDTERAVAEAEAITLTAALEALEAQRQRAVNLAIRGAISDADLDAELRRIVAERAELDRRLAALTPEPEPEPVVSRDLLADLRTRLDAGLSIEQRQEIVRLLVAKIVIHTKLLPDGKKTVRAVAEYRIPGVVPTRTGTGSSPR